MRLVTRSARRCSPTSPAGSATASSSTTSSPVANCGCASSAESWKPTAEALQRNGFEFFSFLSAIDWMPSPYGRGEDNPDDPPPERDPTIRQGYAGGETRFQVFARVVDLAATSA